MDSFGTFHNARRVPGVCLKPVIDPAGWEPQELYRSENWIYRLSDSDIDELADAVDAAEREGINFVDLGPGDFPLAKFGEVLVDLRRELMDGRGLMVLRGLPVAELGRDRAALAYFGIGAHLGRAISQNAHGHLLGHVRNFGKSFDDPNIRGYQSSAALGFHADHCDFVGLLCMQTSKSGGESRVASAVTLYNRMLALRPDLVEELTKDFYWTRHGEVPPGKPPWYTQPVFSFEQGYFSARGVSAFILKAQGLPGVPPFTPAQEEAMALYRETVPQCAADIAFEEGDIQFLHNHVILHSRNAFEDWPEPERRRHLYRLWLGAGDDSRPVPEAVRTSFSGIRVAGYAPKVVVDPEKSDEALV
ncbi:MAG: TauD/TfdA family dioxygenase [Alphaproteobacteria bacterium]|nr:TauD/TfdA family dioxygenase [Alphaproteobacteria bacterium]